MNSVYKPAALGVAVAIAITTTMDATGFSMFSALPLIPLAGLFWYLQIFSRDDVGLVWGDLRTNVLAAGYPLLVLGSIGAIAWVSGAVDTSNADWNKAFLNMAVGSSVGIIMVLITEEGFFRGWLWAALIRARQTDKQVLIWTSIAFTLWHISAISLDTRFDIPASEIPIFLINATLLGAVFGMFRMASGSVVAPSICHAVWNGIDYPLFGFGERVGALGIEQTHIYGPEVGTLGVSVNLVFAVALWFWITRTGRASTAATHSY